jgi:hypothetical protein
MNSNGTASPAYILMFCVAWFLGATLFSFSGKNVLKTAQWSC